MEEDIEQRLILDSKAALRQGNRTLARRIAQQVVADNPDALDAWLILAGLSTPKASLAYLDIAHSLAPEDPRVQAALAWAHQKQESEIKATSIDETHKISVIKPQQADQIYLPITSETHKPVWAWTIAILLILAGLFFIMDAIPWKFVKAINYVGSIVEENFNKPSLTPTATYTHTPTSTFTLTLTPTLTPTFTPTYTASPTEAPTLTPIVLPTNTEAPYIPSVSSSEDERWIDIDLSEQRLYAYEGDTIVGSFVVSTGLPNTPTPIGSFAVWIKLRSTTMSGPGYYLTNVPYTMYFYKDYGIHGTYWHNNFGYPMSHGCVNMVTDEAAWLYDWAYVGITVSVHE